MRFYVDTDERKSMRVEVQEKGKTVNIVGQDHDGKYWTIITFLPDGTFERGTGIPDSLGLQVTKEGRIIETLDKDTEMFNEFKSNVDNMGFEVDLEETRKPKIEGTGFDMMKNEILKIQEGGRNGNGNGKHATIDG